MVELLLDADLIFMQHQKTVSGLQTLWSLSAALDEVRSQQGKRLQMYFSQRKESIFSTEGDK